MGISSISSISNSGISINSGDDPSQLEKQIATIQQQIQQENSSKDDAQTKKAKIQQLQAKLEQIQSQIQQSQSQKIEQTSGSQVEDLKSGSEGKIDSKNSDNIIDVFA